MKILEYGMLGEGMAVESNEFEPVNTSARTEDQFTSVAAC